jgi:hypothetical protein
MLQVQLMMPVLSKYYPIKQKNKFHYIDNSSAPVMELYDISFIIMVTCIVWEFKYSLVSIAITLAGKA